MEHVLDGRMTTDGYCSHAQSLPARGWRKNDRTRATRV